MPAVCAHSGMPTARPSRSFAVLMPASPRTSIAEWRWTRDGKTGIATMGAIPCEVSEIYLPNDSSETSHSSELVKRKVISSIDGKRSEEHTSELQSLRHLVCRLLLEKKNKKRQ